MNIYALVGELQPPEQAMLFLLDQFGYEAVKTNTWLIVPKGKHVCDYVFTAGDLKTLLTTTLSSMELSDKITAALDLRRYLLSSISEPYASINNKFISMFALGRYGTMNLTDHFEITGTPDVWRISRLENKYARKLPTCSGN